MIIVLVTLVPVYSLKQKGVTKFYRNSLPLKNTLRKYKFSLCIPKVIKHSFLDRYFLFVCGNLTFDFKTVLRDFGQIAFLTGYTNPIRSISDFGFLSQ